MSVEKTGGNWRLRVSDILESITKIQAYTKGMTLEQFQSDAKTVDAVIRNFEVIGEAAGYIPEDIQGVYSDLA